LHFLNLLFLSLLQFLCLLLMMAAYKVQK